MTIIDGLSSELQPKLRGRNRRPQSPRIMAERSSPPRCCPSGRRRISSTTGGFQRTVNSRPIRRSLPRRWRCRHELQERIHLRGRRFLL